MKKDVKNFVKYVTFEELDRISFDIATDISSNTLGIEKMTKSERRGAISLLRQINEELEERRSKMI